MDPSKGFIYDIFPMDNSFIDFIQFSLDERKSLPLTFDDLKWQNFFEFCHRHSILGIVFAGLERLNRKIPQDILFEWIGVVEDIKRQNRLMNHRLLDISEWWKERNYRSVILKGQANGLMYPRPRLRSPGDIDIWVEGRTIDIIKTVLKDCPEAHYSIHHVKMPIFDDVSVEVHYRPVFLRNWSADKKFQEFISKIKDDQFSNKIPCGGKMIGCLTDEFNVVYQLLHMYHHFFETRNSFKQFADYYYLLKRGLSEEQKDRVAALIKELRVEKYTRGIMWVMKEVLGLDESKLVVKPDEEIGRVILSEAMRYGTQEPNKLKRVLKRSFDNIRLAAMFPGEVMVNPLFLVWHQWWKFKISMKLNYINNRIMVVHKS